MQITFTKQLALGIGAGVIAMTGVAFTWIAIPHPLPNPALFVPADETTAFFEHITKDNIAFFAHTFPLLTQVPLSETDASVALIKIGDTQTAWALLEPSNNSAQPFHIRTSNPQAAALLTNIKKPLSRDYLFAVLSPEPEDKGARAFIRFPEVTLDSASALGGLLRPDRPASMALTNDGLRVRFLTAHTEKHFSPLENGPKDIFPHPLFIMHASDLSHMLRMSQSILQSTPALVTETVLRQAVASLFGTDISLTYDLTPLLTGTTSLQTAMEPDTHHVHILLEGTIPKHADDLLHLGDLFRAKLGAVTEESPTFDGKFTLPLVRHDLRLLEDETKELNGWTVRTIAQKKTGNTLLIGLRNNTYVLSNDNVAFEKALTTAAPALATLDQAPFGLGIMQSKEISEWLDRRTPTIRPRTDLPSGTGGYLKWKMTQEGERITVLFKKV